MVYYPLQLLQRVGVREVLLVTGKQHAGDFIDLLGDGRVALPLVGRAAVRARPHLQGAGRAGRDRAGRRDGPRLRPRREARRLSRRQHLRECAGRRDRGVGRRRARVRDGGRRPGQLRGRRLRRGRRRQRHRREGRRRRPALPRAALERCGGRALLLPAGRLRDHRLARSRRSRGELEITDVNRAYAERGELERAAGSRAGGTTAASTGATSPTWAG